MTADQPLQMRGVNSGGAGLRGVRMRAYLTNHAIKAITTPPITNASSTHRADRRSNWDCFAWT